MQFYINNKIIIERFKPRFCSRVAELVLKPKFPSVDVLRTSLENSL